MHEQLITSPLPKVRAAAVTGIKYIKDESSIRYLLQAWIREEHPQLKSYMRKTLNYLYGIK